MGGGRHDRFHDVEPNNARGLCIWDRIFCRYGDSRVCLAHSRHSVESTVRGARHFEVHQARTVGIFRASPCAICRRVLRMGGYRPDLPIPCNGVVLTLEVQQDARVSRYGIIVPALGGPPMKPNPPNECRK